MKSDRAMKHFILAFLLAVGCYALFYTQIQNRRMRKGPWRVTFTQNSEGAPTLLINQPKLTINNVRISFPDESADSTNLPTTIVFDQARPVPFEVPFGKCIFLDTTFLPGTVTFRLFDHEIELLPRVLITDRQERQWSDQPVILHPVQPASTLVPPGQTNRSL